MSDVHTTYYHLLESLLPRVCPESILIFEGCFILEEQNSTMLCIPGRVAKEPKESDLIYDST